MDPVAVTALWVAALRALESERDDRLFEDPFARALAGEEGHAAMEHFERGQMRVPAVEVRTVFLDERVAAAAEAGLRQVVLLAAGLDARAYRLRWPAGVRLFEIDRPEILERKQARLWGAKPHCDRHAIAADLREDWPAALTAAGFDAARPTLWLAEGLLVYLGEPAAHALLARVSAVSAPGSVLLCDVSGRSLLESPWTRPMIDRMAEMGAPWLFGTDAPAELFASLGWDAAVTEHAELGTRLGRWPFPLVPAGVPGAPRSYLVEATKRGGGAVNEEDVDGVVHRRLDEGAIACGAVSPKYFVYREDDLDPRHAIPACPRCWAAGGAGV